MHTNRIHSIFILWRYPNPYYVFGMSKKTQNLLLLKNWQCSVLSWPCFLCHPSRGFLLGKFHREQFPPASWSPPNAVSTFRCMNCNLPRRGGVSSMIYLLNRLTLSLIVVLQKNASRVANRDLWSRCAFFSNSTNHGKSMYCKS